MDPEDDYKPFEVVEEDGRTILRLHGIPGKHAKVEADKVLIIMDAIAQGWDIDIEFADIDGALDIGEIFDELERPGDGRPVIKGNIRMLGCNISGYVHLPTARFSRNVNFESAQFSRSACFGAAQFSGDACFWSTRHSGDADFQAAQFSRDADFRFAQFSGDADFRSAHFGGDANFRGVAMVKPATFADVTFRENHVFKGLWNATLGRIERLHWQVTDFSGFNTETVMDGASNPWLKRHIDDELWIQSWRTRPKWRWWRELWFIIWELTSHCGRSIGLWAFWSVLIAVVFAFIYQAFGPESITFNVDKLRNFQPDLWDYLYYSVVTFTTLGFGDIVPLTKPARFAVGAEVVLGYVMLGGLISIFANKLARRS